MISWAVRPLPGISDFGDAPDLGDVRAVLGVLDVAVAGQLVALVAVLAPALPVALPGDGAVAAARLADPPGGEHEVDARQHVLDALRVVLDAARVQQQAGLGRCPTSRPPRSIGRRVTPVSSPAHAGVYFATAASASSKPGRVFVDEVVVQPAALDQHVQDRRSSGPSRVPGRTGNRSAVRASGRDPRVDHDQLGAAVARPPDVAGGDRRALGDVRAGDEDDIGERDVGPGVGGPVDAERLLVARARPTPCRAARCSRGSRSASATRANLPTR